MGVRQSSLNLRQRTHEDVESAVRFEIPAYIRDNVVAPGEGQRLLRQMYTRDGIRSDDVEVDPVMNDGNTLLE